MQNPHLLFCPYLPLAASGETIEFADWELGPLWSFEGRWADPKFESQAKTLLGKFSRPLENKPIENPALLCKKGEQIDGRMPSGEEWKALQLALAFGFLDTNPTQESGNGEAGWGTLTTDNVDVQLWSLDLEHKRVALTRGYLVKVNIGGFTLDDSGLFVAPPLELHMPTMSSPPDPLVLTGIYETVLASLRSPDTEPDAHRVRVAVEWLAKAWQNTRSLRFPERLVFLKTAFEAITGKSNAYEGARKLRMIFESLSNTTEDDSDCLVWSPEEKPIHNHTWNDKHGQAQSTLITDLEAWFLAFSKTRNAIIHEGIVPGLTYPNSTSDPLELRAIYHGGFFYTAERLLRSVTRVLLSKLGYKDAWRDMFTRVVLEAYYKTI